MPQLSAREIPEGQQTRAEREKAIKILAKSIFRELKTNGYDGREIVALSTELISLLTTEIKPEK